jgi:HrpA-like RNA helicase
VNEEEINYELIEELIMKISRDYEDGGILVFLPGLMEITTLYEQLLSNRYTARTAAPGWWVVVTKAIISTHAYARTRMSAER